MVARSRCVILVVCLPLVCGCRPSRVSVSDAPSAISIRPAQPPPAVVIRPQVTAPVNPWAPSQPPRDWQYVVIHHTASSSGSVESIHEEHLKRPGWQGIGYHFVIGNGKGMPDGEIEPTFRWREQIQGAHAGKKEFNEQGIGVCLVGNFEDTQPTAQQLASVKRLVGVLKREYGIPTDRVIAHRDVKATACPGRNFPIAEVAESGLVSVLAHSQR